MLKDHVKLLDTDEPNREAIVNSHKELVELCKKYDLVLDLSSSDVVCFIEDGHGHSICLG